MNRTTEPQDTQPYERAHHFESEPVLFAVGLVAVVMAISLWRPLPGPLPEPRQAVPASQPATVAELPRA